MSKAELIKRFSDYVYCFNAYCTSDAEDHEMLKAVLALLKEQEAVEPDTDSEGNVSCGTCGTNVGYYPAGCSVPEKLCKYCPECGQAVKWE